MGKIRLCILDTNLRYATMLMEYLNRNQERIPFETSVFTTEEKLLESVRTQGVDLVLTAIEPSEDYVKLEYAKVCLILSETGKGCERFPQGICRYRSMEEIQRQLLSIYLEKESREEIVGQRSKPYQLFTVFSPVGGVDAEEFSAQLAIYFQKNIGEQREVLHICLEPFAGNGQDGFSRLSYDISQKKKNLALGLQGLVRKQEGVSWLPPPGDFAECLEFGVEEMKWLFSHCLEQAGYPVVVMNVGYLTEGTLYALGRSDQIFLPLRKGEMDNERVSVFRQQLNSRGLYQVLGKIRCVELTGALDEEKLEKAEEMNHIFGQLSQEIDWKF